MQVLRFYGLVLHDCHEAYGVLACMRIIPAWQLGQTLADLPTRPLLYIQILYAWHHQHQCMLVRIAGDHKQLRPKVESYDLTVQSGKGHTLNVSLFERLVLE